MLLNTVARDSWALATPVSGVGGVAHESIRALGWGAWCEECGCHRYHLSAFPRTCGNQVQAMGSGSRGWGQQAQHSHHLLGQAFWPGV